MKAKLLTGLALAAALLIGQPAFAHGKHGGGGAGRGHAVAAVHRSGGGSHVRIASRGGGHAFRGTRVASFRKTSGGRTFAAANMGRTNRIRPSIALTGNSRYSSAGNRGGGGHHGTYAFATHNGWNHDREYSWNGHRYHWYGDGWYIIDAYPFGAPWPYYSGPGYNTDSVAVQVQQDLAHDGYYSGPIDGVIGPGTSNAIAAYQQDNGLPVTGAINGPLLRSMGL